MKNTSKLCLLFSLLSMGSVSYGACTADPNQIIQSSQWAFQLVAGDYSPPGSAAVGIFRAQPNGVLQITETYGNVLSTARGQQAGGRYIVYPDCSGGELMFMANGLAMQLEFVYTNNFEKMLLVTDELNARYGGTMVMTGYARRTTTGCPAGLGDPLNILNGSTWSFRTFPAYYPGGPSSSSVGVFKPYISGSGRLSGTETINNGSYGPIIRQAQESGRYIINADCSGGEIMLMNRGNPVPSLQLEFVFVGPNYSEMYMLNDSPMGGLQMPSAAPAAMARQSLPPVKKEISLPDSSGALSVVAGYAEKF